MLVLFSTVEMNKWEGNVIYCRSTVTELSLHVFSLFLLQSLSKSVFALYQIFKENTTNNENTFHWVERATWPSSNTM